MPSFNTAGRAYIGTIELDDIEIDLDMTTIVSECRFNDLLTEMIDQNAERALTAISETCANSKYPQLLNAMARIDPYLFNNCLSAAGWMKTADINALDNFLTAEIIDWLTECRTTQLAEYVKAHAPKRLSEVEATAIAMVANYMDHRVKVAHNEVTQLENLTVHTDLLHAMLVESLDFEERI